MPALIIPLLIVLGIVGFSTGGNVIKSVVSSFSDVGFQSAPAPSPPPPKTSTIKQTPPTKATLKPATPKPTLPPPPASPAPTIIQAPSTNSPYFQKIKISSFRPLSGSNTALATLRPSFSEGEIINITGWRLNSKWTGEFKIPYAIEKYHPVLNGQSTEPILVKRQDTLYISSSKSPLGRGRNFRPNQCFGYLRSSAGPSLPGPSSCSQDKPQIQQISFLSPLCQEFILNKINYSSCYLPDTGVPTEPGCSSYLTALAGSFSYEGCYQKRSQDKDFTSNEWHIYVESDFGNLFHDTITLLDQTGLTVDTYIY
ncbi:MAG: hypothetical protein Greene071421_69 [Parcubacteria group bacterium Greene0714_21]|nr:MAG: hypothetical protein Greene101447_274 [Parcubacteria group bacterium Greene1014_47]TSD04583.1 MAG: hypothetical protein Greene071421_69 [Parcubacteria group bacterium Greene0714_21]